MLGREKSSGEEYLPESEAHDRPQEAAFDMEAKEAVDKINESSLIVLTTFSSNGRLNRRLSVPGATKSSRFTDSPTGQEV